MRTYPPFVELPTNQCPVPAFEPDSGLPLAPLVPGDSLVVTTRTPLEALWWQAMVSLAAQAKANLYLASQDWPPHQWFNQLLTVEHFIRPSGFMWELRELTATIVPSTADDLKTLGPRRPTTKTPKRQRPPKQTLAQTVLVQARLRVSGRGDQGGVQRRFTAYFSGRPGKDGRVGSMGMVVGAAPPVFRLADIRSSYNPANVPNTRHRRPLVTTLV